MENNVEDLRERVNRVRRLLDSCFVGKKELVDLMVVCMLAQEPMLLIGKPGTAKSDLVIKFSQILGLEEGEYFEYMLTKFTEPSEIVGPIDIQELKAGKYIRRVEGKLPKAKVVFLDEIFKSNSAILNTLLTVINERKYYQEGRPVPVEMRMLFAATNEIPDFTELDALKDRFVIKAESTSVRGDAFDALIDQGLRNEMLRLKQQRPWERTCTLRAFEDLKAHIDEQMFESEMGTDRARYFPGEIYTLFKRILRSLEREDRIEISDRKVVKLYRLIRVRAFLFHGGVVRKSDLGILRYIANRQQDIEPIRRRVTSLLQISS